MDGVVGMRCVVSRAVCETWARKVLKSGGGMVGLWFCRAREKLAMDKLVELAYRKKTVRV